MYKCIYYVCVSGDGKIGRRRRCTGNIASFLNIFPDSSFGSVCLTDCFGSLISVARPVAVYLLGDVSGTVEVRARCCQYVWVTASSLKAP